MQLSEDSSALHAERDSLALQKGEIMIINQNVKQLAQKYKVDTGALKSAIDKIKNDEVILYAMSGKMGAGKDTIAALIADKLNNYNVVTLSYGSPIRKEMDEINTYYLKTKDLKKTAELFEATEENIRSLVSFLENTDVYARTHDARLAVQFWGADVRRNQDKNYWINKLIQMIVDFLNDGRSVCVSDVRFINEADSIIALNGKIIRVEVPEEVRLERIRKRDNMTPTKKELEHYSEIILDNYDFERKFDGEQLPKIIAEQAVIYLGGKG